MPLFRLLILKVMRDSTWSHQVVEEGDNHFGLGRATLAACTYIDDAPIEQGDHSEVWELQYRPAPQQLT